MASQQFPAIGFALPMRRAEVAPQAPTIHRASIGRRRAFQSRRDVMAYETGYRKFAAGQPQPAEVTPERMGWFDAEVDALDTADQHLDHGRWGMQS